MAKTIEGDLSGKGKRFAVIVSRYNELIGSKLLGGAIDCLTRHEVAGDDVTIYWVPGAFEIPFALERALAGGKYDAVCCLGAVIRGATPHFDYVSAEATKGIANVTLKYGKPVSFGVLTVDSIEQAIERAGTKAGNKGGEAMASLIELINLYDELA